MPDPEQDVVRLFTDAAALKADVKQGARLTLTDTRCVLLAIKSLQEVVTHADHK